MQIEIAEGEYQDLFLFSDSKFPCLKAGVGTGKTMCLLIKIFNYCEQYPGTTGLIVRREFTDLRDSTMIDFEKYFSVKIGSDKNYTFPNKSKLMFRHGSELAVLKNMTLGIIGIEQAEEFETDEQFHFLRDRLRQKNGAKVRPLCVIANANGHNWVWDLWIKGADAETIDATTGQFKYRKEFTDLETGETQYYECITANTFANKKNLPSDFLSDMRQKEFDAPNNYHQYVMNLDDVTDDDDLCYPFTELTACRHQDWLPRTGYGARVAGFDIARYGNDKCACVCIEQVSALYWRVCHVEQWEHRDLDYTTGRILSLSAQLGTLKNVVDEDGIGAGPLDSITKGRGRTDFAGFRNPVLSYEKNKFYGNARTVSAFELKDLIAKRHISLEDEGLIQELSTMRYRFANDGRRILVSKEEMRKDKIKSPNMADALLMAISQIKDLKYEDDNKYVTMPQYYEESGLFAVGGVR